MSGDTFAFHDLGCDTQILDAPVGTASDHHLIDLDIIRDCLFHRLAVTWEERVGNDWRECCHIDRNLLTIARICIRGMELRR